MGSRWSARVLCVTTFAACWPSIEPGVLQAQGRSSSRAQVTAAASATLHDLPFVSSDSVRMAWGHVNYSRYETPYQCVHATNEVKGLATRRTLDTARYSDRVHSSWPAEVRTTARACFAQLSATGVDQIAPHRLWALFDVALLSDDAASVQMVLRRLLALAPTAAARENIFLRVLEQYMASSTRPIQLDSARSLLRQLDAQQVSIITRLKGRNILAAYYANTFDIPEHRQQLDSALALTTRLTAAERINEEALSQQLTLAYGYLRDAMFTAPQTIHSLLEEIKRRAIESKHPMSSLVVGGAAEQQRLYDHLGVEAPTITSADAPLWFNRPGDTTHVWPQPGKVSLLLTLGKDAIQPDGPFVLLANVVRRLLGTYGERGLEVTLLVPTRGYAFSDRALKPDAEAAELQSVVRRVLKLPIRLIVVESPTGRLPDPDGRLYERGNAPLIQSLVGRTILTDRQGRIVALTNEPLLLNQNSDDEGMWDAFIRREVMR